MPPKIKVKITRQYSAETQILGDLTMPGFECKTLELPNKNNLPNISCIPKGIYNCRWTFSWKFLRYTYEVTDVIGRSGIRFHPANFFFDLKGCIALGDKYGDLNRDAWADLINSKITVAKFEQLLNKKSFQLTIL